VEISIPVTVVIYMAKFLKKKLRNIYKTKTTKEHENPMQNASGFVLINFSDNSKS